MKADLLYIYIKNHLIPVGACFFVAAIFLSLKIYLYGVPEFSLSIIFLMLLTCSFFMVLHQHRIYREVITKQNLSSADASKTIRLLSLYKVGYLLPWLLILFWPFRTEFVFDHLVGYIYVFCAVAVYMAISPACFSLFIVEIFLHLAVAAIITALNYNIQETAYVGAFIIIFGSYTIIAGRKLSNSTVQILKSKVELEKAVTVAKKANQAKSDFLGIISHEIRTPMVGIMGMIDILGETKITPEQRECVNVVHQCSKSLLNTLNDLLDTSRMEAGTFSLVEEDFNCIEMLQNTAKVFVPVAAGKQILFTITIDDNFPEYIHGDSNRLQQVVVNLLNNAIKFTERGEVSLHAGFHAETNQLFIKVIDTGIGISAKDQKNLFQRFSQANSSIGRKYGGTGLGLSIAKTLVEMMGGYLNLKSDKGQGSTFIVEIPHRKAQKSKEFPIAEAKSLAGVFEILLVEDNQINSMVTSRLLKKKGHAVTQAYDANGALDAVRKHDFSLILMDINLPDMNGLEVTKKIRELGGDYKAVPIIALSANGIQEQIDSCLNAGMAGFLIKPFAPQELYDVINGFAKPYNERRRADRYKKTSSAKVQSITEELGPEYMSYLMKRSTEELDRLNSLLVLAGQTADSEATHKIAHEIKGVGGMVGFDEIVDLAQSLEGLPYQQFDPRAIDLINRLDGAVKRLID